MPAMSCGHLLPIKPRRIRVRLTHITRIASARTTSISNSKPSIYLTSNMPRQAHVLYAVQRTFRQLFPARHWQQ